MCGTPPNQDLDNNRRNLDDNSYMCGTPPNKDLDNNRRNLDGDTDKLN